MVHESRPDLVLASASRSRAFLLEAAGIPYRCDPARIDEEAVKSSLLAEGARPQVVAEALAEMKALRVSARHPDALCLGADQTLTHDGRLHDKPTDLQMARAQLLTLRGGEHQLDTVAVVAREGRAIWRSAGQARIRMRMFSEEFVDGYLHGIGEAAFSSPGAYQIEGTGVQLMDRVEGDHSVILGLPLLPLLAFLREWGVVGT